MWDWGATAAEVGSARGGHGQSADVSHPVKGGLEIVLYIRKV